MFKQYFAARYDALKAQNEASSSEDLEKELGDLKLRYKKLKVLRILLLLALTSMIHFCSFVN